jgi:hypothetical protein
MMLISAPTARPTATAPNTPIGPNTSDPARPIRMVSGSIQVIRKYEAMPVSAIDTQFPRFSAPCTLPPSFTRTIRMPIREKTIPIPAITIGSRIGLIPPKASPVATTSRPSTIVARMVAT